MPLFLLVVSFFVVALYYAKHRLHAALVMCLLFGFSIIITVIPLRDLEIPADYKSYDEELTPRPGGALILSILFTFCVLPTILFSVAPAKAISRRLIFLALGLLLLIALNELSKFGFDLTPPKHQG